MVTITMNDKSKIELDAEIVGGVFAVHPGVKSDGKWTVTHIPSGRAVKSGLDSQEMAQRLARYCLEHPDCNKAKPEATAESSQAYVSMISLARWGKFGPSPSQLNRLQSKGFDLSKFLGE